MLQLALTLPLKLLKNLLPNRYIYIQFKHHRQLTVVLKEHLLDTKLNCWGWRGS